MISAARACVCINGLSVSRHFGLFSSSQDCADYWQLFSETTTKMMTPSQIPEDGIAALLEAASEVHSHLSSPTASQARMAEEFRRMSETFSAHLIDISSKINSLAERVDEVEKWLSLSRQQHVPSSTPNPGSENRPPRALPSEPATPSWADRDPSERFVQDPNEILRWPDDEEQNNDADHGCTLFNVSVATGSLLRDAFTKMVPNGTRRRWREHYRMPTSRFTKCPKLDTMLKSKLPKQCKDADRPLAKNQALLLDAVGPLTHLLEKELPKEIADTVTQSIRFLGNASANISSERRRRAGSFLNDDLKCLIEEMFLVPKKYVRQRPVINSICL